jgi:hypothetical protein
MSTISIAFSYSSVIYNHFILFPIRFLYTNQFNLEQFVDQNKAQVHQLFALRKKGGVMQRQRGLHRAFQRAEMIV